MTQICYDYIAVTDRKAFKDKENKTNMVKPICCNSYILNDPIVLDGIRAIEEIKKSKKVKGHIAGGMGVQSYIPEKFHRKTIDLDFSMLWSGGAEDFRNLTIPLKSFLESKGYEVELKKRHSTYDYVISRGENSFMVQHRKESKNHFDRVIRNSIEREVANQREIAKGDLTYHVLSPEDLAIHKLNRANIFTKKYGIKKPLFVSLPLSLENLIILRKDLVSNFDNVSPEEIANLRLLCDLFDVKCLGEYANFDKSYFHEVMKEYVDHLELNPIEVYEDLENLQISFK